MIRFERLIRGIGPSPSPIFFILVLYDVLVTVHYTRVHVRTVHQWMYSYEYCGVQVLHLEVFLELSLMCSSRFCHSLAVYEAADGGRVRDRQADQQRCLRVRTLISRQQARTWSRRRSRSTCFAFDCQHYTMPYVQSTVKWLRNARLQYFDNCSFHSQQALRLCKVQRHVFLM